MLKRAIFIMGWIGGELADVFKDDREVVFMIRLEPKISTLSTNEPKIIFTVHGTVSPIFIMGWIGGELADVFKDDRKVVFMIALFIPLLSILGVSLVRLNPVPISKLNKHVLFGGLENSATIE
jgi:hypothetical protein